MASIDIAGTIVACVAIVCYTAYYMLEMYLDRVYERDDEEG